MRCACPHSHNICVNFSCFFETFFSAKNIGFFSVILFCTVCGSHKMKYCVIRISYYIFIQIVNTCILCKLIFRNICSAVKQSSVKNQNRLFTIHIFGNLRFFILLSKLNFKQFSVKFIRTDIFGGFALTKQSACNLTDCNCRNIKLFKLFADIFQCGSLATARSSRQYYFYNFSHKITHVTY